MRSALSFHVGVVVLLRAFEQVLEPYARRIVAGVQDILCRPFARFEKPSGVSCLHALTLEPDFSIPTQVVGGP